MPQPDIRVLTAGDRDTLEAFLLPRIETSMFLLSNMRQTGLLDTGYPYSGAYAAAFGGPHVVAVVAHFWNNNLILQAPVHAVPLCRAAIAASGRPLGGLIGPAEQVAQVKAGLQPPAASLQMDDTDKLYRMQLSDLILPEPLRSGQLTGRRATMDDLDVLVPWQVAYGVEALAEEESPDLWAKVREGVTRQVEERRTWVLEKEGELVACSSFNSAIREAVQIGGVWTPPALRSQGYGRAVVAASLLDARAEGVETAILFTAEVNFAAQKAYEALGFQHIGDYSLVLIRPPLTLG
jgi:predicted GNAT family acetyltransferase